MTNRKKAKILILLSVLVLVVAFGLSLFDKRVEVGNYPQGQNSIEFKDSYAVGFEGDFTRLNYSLKYDPAVFRVANLPNKSVIRIKDVKGGEISKIGIFYNGAAGFSGVKDFFENVSLGETMSDKYDVVNLNLKMFGRLPDGAYAGSEGDRVAIFKNDIGFVYVETENLSDSLLQLLDSFRLDAGEKTSVMPTGVNVKVYYFNDSIRKNNNCDEVLPMTSMVFDTKNLAEASLRILLDGPSPADVENGYVSAIPAAVWLNSVKIEDGVAYADFSKELSGAAGSCRILGIKTQIEKTLLQFSTIKKVKISVEGKTEGILEP